MKQYIFVLFFLFTNYLSSAQELTWFTNANEAVKKSNSQNKPLLMFFTGSDWCGWCIRLQKEVFSQPEFKQWAIENVVLLELDFPRRSQQEESLKNQNAQILNVFGVRGYPTIWIVKPTLNSDKVNFDPLGSIGYIAGGPNTWIESANKILIKK